MIAGRPSLPQLTRSGTGRPARGRRVQAGRSLSRIAGLRGTRRVDRFEALGGGDEPRLDRGSLIGAEALFDGVLERVDGGSGRLESLPAFRRERDLQDAAVRWGSMAFDHALTAEGGQHPVHRLWGRVAGARQIRARQAGVSGEHAERRVLGAGQTVRAQRGFHRAAERMPRLAQQVAGAPLDTAIALSDSWWVHATQDIKVLTISPGLVIISGP